MSVGTVDAQSETKWHAIAAEIKPEVRLFIDGEYVDAVEGGRFESINPATGECFESLLEYTDTKSVWIEHG